MTAYNPPNPQISDSEPTEITDRYTRNGITIRRKKIKDGNWGKWTCRIRFQREVHAVTLSERATESITMALRARREIQAGRWNELKSIVGLRDRPVATLAQLKTAYLAAPVEARASTRQQNWNALEQLICNATAGADTVSLSRSSTVINAELATAWFKTAATRVEAETDQARQATIKRSVNSRYSQAASVFTTRALASYKLANLHHDGYDKFLAAGEVYQFVRIPKQEYLPPSEKTIKDTFTAWEALTDRDLFLALGHELAFGLRAGETVQVKWGWWTVREGYPVLDGTGDFKSGTGRLTVRALDPWFSTMRERILTKHWKGKDDDYVLSGHATQRSDLVYRAASQWLRERGWGTQKTNHALRAYAGSQVAMRYGIYDAQTWLRHSSVLVTEQHYSYFIKAFKPANVETMTVRWAIETREFQPVILPSASNA